MKKVQNWTIQSLATTKDRRHSFPRDWFLEIVAWRRGCGVSVCGSDGWARQRGVKGAWDGRGKLRVTCGRGKERRWVKERQWGRGHVFVCVRSTRKHWEDLGFLSELYIYLFIYFFLSINLSIYPSIHLSIYPFIYTFFTYISIFLYRSMLERQIYTQSVFTIVTHWREILRPKQQTMN